MKNKKPVFYLGYAWDKDFNKKTKKKHQKFYKKHGWDPTYTWNLDDTIARFTLPLLIHFRENLHGYPSGLTEKKWNKILKKIIRAFELVIEDDVFNHDNEKEIKKGMKLFSKYYRNLWD